MVALAERKIVSYSLCLSLILKGLKVYKVYCYFYCNMTDMAELVKLKKHQLYLLTGVFLLVLGLPKLLYSLFGNVPYINLLWSKVIWNPVDNLKDLTQPITLFLVLVKLLLVVIGIVLFRKGFKKLEN